jgi:hypothetical protein
MAEEYTYRRQIRRIPEGRSRRRGLPFLDRGGKRLEPIRHRNNARFDLVTSEDLQRPGAVIEIDKIG